MKKINISTKKYPNKFVLVDNEDYECLNQWRWHYDGTGYAVRKIIKNKNVWMHRFINKTPQGFLTDHISRNKLDNRKNNLRIADTQLSAINRGMQSNNTSGHKGVSWDKKSKKWQSFIHFMGKKYNLGYFIDLKKAIKTRKVAEKILFIR
jgi:hypothetical protein